MGLCETRKVKPGREQAGILLKALQSSPCPCAREVMLPLLAQLVHAKCGVPAMPELLNEYDVVQDKGVVAGIDDQFRVSVAGSLNPIS